MQQATVVLPLGNTVPETWVQLELKIGTLQGLVIFAGGKKTTAPLEPWHEIEMSVGQANSGWQLPVCGGQLVTSTLKQQQRRKPWLSLTQQTTLFVPGGKNTGWPGWDWDSGLADWGSAGHFAAGLRRAGRFSSRRRIPTRYTSGVLCRL